MTVDLFLKIFIGGSLVSSLLTQAIKKWYENAHKEYSANVVALVNAIIVGCGGTAIGYMLLGIPWTVNNIICLVLMGVAVWIASMIGYDKVIQTLKQIFGLSDNKEEKKKESDTPVVKG